MKRVWAFYLLLPFLLMGSLLAVGFSGSSAAAPGSSVAAEVRFPVDVDTLDPNETLRLVNQKRSEVGLPALIADEQLAAVARDRAADMVARQYYAHRNPEGRFYYDYLKERAIAAGYSCENLDLVFVPSQELVLREWQASLKGHRDCMLHPKTNKAGFATAKLIFLNFSGKPTTGYLVVAIHADLSED